MSHAESWLVEQITFRRGEFASGVIGSPFHAMLDRLQGQAPAGVKLVQPALLHALEECHWQDMGRLHSAAYSTKKQVFVAPDVARQGLSKSDLRRMAEPPAPPALTLVTKKPAV